MVEEIINNCSVEGNLIRLPEGQLDRKVYEQVAGKLKKIGGRWKGGKVQAFVFDHDPSGLLADIQSGKDRNIKKEFQFFATPEKIAKRLVALAEVKPTDLVLEPSAGLGAIMKEIPECLGIHYCEANPNFLKPLQQLSIANRTVFVTADFLNFVPGPGFEKIIANPPFTKNQDIDHIRLMYDHLAPGGRLVSIASTHWRHSTAKKETAFRDWLFDLDAEVQEITPGEFKESGTQVGAVIIILDKPKPKGDQKQMKKESIDRSNTIEISDDKGNTTGPISVEKFSRLADDVLGKGASEEFAIPPKTKFEGKDFIAAPELKKIGDKLIEHFDDDFGFLDGANILYLWKEKGGESGGMATLGKCIKPSGLAGYFAAEADDADRVHYIVWAAADHLRLNKATVRTVYALIFHELMHTDTNEGKLTVRGHEFEGFAREIEEFGFWRQSITNIAGAVEKVKDDQQGLFNNF